MEGHEPPLPKERRRASVPPPASSHRRRRRSLSEFGLKYDDIRIESDADYAKALDRLQQCVQIKFNAAFRATRREYLYVPQPSAPASTTASPL